MAQDDLEFIRAVRALDEASKRLNAGADKLFDGQRLTDKVFDKFGLSQVRDFQKKASEFLNQRKLMREQEREVRQRLGIGKERFKQLKKEAELTKKKEEVDKAFKSFVENNLGLNEELLNQLRFIRDVKEDKSGNLRDRKGRFTSLDAPDKFIKKITDEFQFNRQFVDKMGLNKQDLISGDITGAKSPGDMNRAAEEERTRDQQAFEMEKTESTNDILRDILAALTGSGIAKKEEGGSGGGFLAGLLGAKGLGALKKAIGGVATALGAATLAGARGAANVGKGLLGKLGSLATIVGPAAPLVLGLGAAAGAFLLLKDRSEEFRKKVEEDTKKLGEALAAARTAEEVKLSLSSAAARQAEVDRQSSLIGGRSDAQVSASAKTGETIRKKIDELNVIESAKNFNELLKTTNAYFVGTRDAAIKQGDTLESRYAFYDKAIEQTVEKLQKSQAYLSATKDQQEYMIGQVVSQANKVISGAGGKSALLKGLNQEAMRNAAQIETNRARAFMTLQYGGTDTMAEEGYGYLSKILGGGDNRYSRKRIELLQARVAEAKKNADEVTWWERNVGSNQGDVDRLNALTKELEKLREAIAAAARGGPVAPVIAPTTNINNSSSPTSVSTPIHITDPNRGYVTMY